MNIDDFDLRNFLPYYLTEEQKTSLASALKQFSAQSYLYTHMYMDETLQGDCWDKVPFRDFGSGKTANIRAILLSNTCDISEENDRDLPVNLTYAPIIYLDDYETLLLKAGLDPDLIKKKFINIKSQRITNILYLPAGANIEKDCIALLDKTVSIPFLAFANEENKAKLVTLNQLGHYILSFKLSIHFCRLHEAVNRDQQTAI